MDERRARHWAGRGLAAGTLLALLAATSPAPREAVGVSPIPALSVRAEVAASCGTLTPLSGRTEPLPAGLVLLTNGLLRIVPCEPDYARIVLEGSSAADIGSAVTVTREDGTTLYAAVLTGRTSLRLDGRFTPGALYIGFHNDLADASGDRNVTVRWASNDD